MRLLLLLLLLHYRHRRVRANIIGANERRGCVSGTCWRIAAATQAASRRHCGWKRTSTPRRLALPAAVG